MSVGRIWLGEEWMMQCSSILFHIEAQLKLFLQLATRRVLKKERQLHFVCWSGKGLWKGAKKSGFGEGLLQLRLDDWLVQMLLKLYSGSRISLEVCNCCRNWIVWGKCGCTPVMCAEYPTFYNSIWSIIKRLQEWAAMVTAVCHFDSDFCHLGKYRMFRRWRGYRTQKFKSKYI